MFGYVTVNYKALSKEEQEQYQRYYCGLCRGLEHRYGNISRLTLNNDMTFLLILLSSLYEPAGGGARGPLPDASVQAYALQCAQRTVRLLRRYDHFARLSQSDGRPRGRQQPAGQGGRGGAFKSRIGRYSRACIPKR